MEELIVKSFLSKETIFACLFIYLFVRQLKHSEIRENKLYTFLDDMKTEFAKLVNQYERISNDVEDIKKEIKHHKGDI